MIVYLHFGMYRSQIKSDGLERNRDQIPREIKIVLILISVARLKAYPHVIPIRLEAH